jgi:hypothetical protein
MSNLRLILPPNLPFMGNANATALGSAMETMSDANAKISGSAVRTRLHNKQALKEEMV